MMLNKLVSKLSQRVGNRSSTTSTFVSKSSDWFLFPREAEGNNYSVNWSLAEDGVTNSSEAYRNARLSILTNRLPSKVVQGAVSLKKPVYSGEYIVREAGDTISHSEFQTTLSSLQEYFSSGITLFVEDACLGSYGKNRVGVRVLTENAAVALVCRNLLMPMPPRSVDHKARFRGWNFDPRWMEPEVKWNGETYDISETPTVEAQGQRPVVVHVGGPGKDASLQFVENSNSKIIGANVIIGSEAPVSALIDAVGTASCAVINAEHASSVAIPSLSILKANGAKTTLVIGADEALVHMACSKNVAHGVYHNVLTPVGVSAMWNGAVVTAPGSGSTSNAPSVIVGDQCASVIHPNNLAYSADHIIFYKKGAKRSSVSEAEAVKMIVELCDESKQDTIAALVKQAKIEIVGDASDTLSDI